MKRLVFILLVFNMLGCTENTKPEVIIDNFIENSIINNERSYIEYERELNQLGRIMEIENRTNGKKS